MRRINGFENSQVGLNYMDPRNDFGDTKTIVMCVVMG